MAILRPITDGKVSGADTIKCSTRILGGIMISADGANDATVVVRSTDASGAKVVDVTTKNSMFIVAPFECEENINYNISGTGASAMLYEWTP